MISSYEKGPIVGLASHPGISAIAIIRASGPGILQRLAQNIRYSKNMNWPPAARKMVRVSFVDEKNGAVIDEILLCYFPGPRSFTGEDIVELYPHGSPYIVRLILERLFRSGFRQAMPGEFSRRAFFNGKMDLAMAEGISALTAAQTEGQWLAARQLASGETSSLIRFLRDKVIQALALMEASIDFPDEGDTQRIELGTVDKIVNELDLHLERLLSSFASGRIAVEGFRVALVGEPNAGKSTLLNELLGHDRAIVTSTPGTTRDYLEETCVIEGRLFCLYDTAGIRNTKESVELIGIERSQKIAREADLIVHVMDATKKSHMELKELVGDQAFTQPVLPLLSKLDLVKDGPLEPEVLAVSVRNGEGLSDLKKTLVSYVDSQLRNKRHEDSLMISSVRHRIEIEKAKHALSAYHDARSRGEYEECLAFELKQAAAFLDSILGRVDNENILDAVFSQFCVGK